MKKMVYGYYNEESFRKATNEDIKLAKQIYKICSATSNSKREFPCEHKTEVINVVGALYFNYDDTTETDWFKITKTGITVRTKIFQRLDVRNKAIRAELKRLTKVLCLKKIPVKDRVILIHDYLCNTDEYNYDYRVKLDYGFSIYDALFSGKAICSGYSRAFKALCDYVDVPCDYLSSVTANHAWNRVVIDGETLYLDVTWDDTANSKKYFLKTEEEFAKIHPMHEEVNKKIWQI